MMPSARTEAVAIAKEKLALHPVYLDTETTGSGPIDEIIEIGIVDDEGKVLFESFVKPMGSVSAEARRVHGITDDMLASAPRWLHVWPKVEAAVAGKAVGIYNADFDLRLLQQTHAKYKMRWSFPGQAFCVMKLYARFHGEWNSRTMDFKWQSLTAAGQQCRIPLPNAHRTIADTLLTRAILRYMAGEPF
jgi:DNA polymerase-3 subunit epsilon